MKNPSSLRKRGIKAFFYLLSNQYLMGLDSIALISEVKEINAGSNILKPKVKALHSCFPIDLKLANISPFEITKYSQSRGFIFDLQN